MRICSVGPTDYQEVDRLVVLAHHTPFVGRRINEGRTNGAVLVEEATGEVLAKRPIQPSRCRSGSA